MRTTIEAMAATQGHTQSLHTNALDEALALADRFFGADCAQHAIVPAAGKRHQPHHRSLGRPRIMSERLTRDLAAKAWGHIREVEALGGMAKAIEAAFPKLRIEEASAKTQARIDAGKQAVIGVNKYKPIDEAPLDVLKVENSTVRRLQIDKARALAERAQPEGRRRRAGVRSPAAPRGQRQPVGAGDRCRAPPKPPSANIRCDGTRCSGGTAPK